MEKHIVWVLSRDISERLSCQTQRQKVFFSVMSTCTSNDTKSGDNFVEAAGGGMILDTSKAFSCAMKPKNSRAHARSSICIFHFAADVKERP